MALTNNGASDGGRQPSAPIMSGTIDVDLDNSYPLTASEGYPLTKAAGAATDILPAGVTIIHSDFVPNYDGGAKRWIRIVQGTLGPVIKAYADTNAAPGAEAANAADLSGHTGVKIGWTGK